MKVNPLFAARTSPEFIAYAKASPGKLTMASGGIGSPNHIAGELFKMMAGVDMIHVPYRGDTPAIADLTAGQVQVYFGTLGGSTEHIRAGKLRALAVTTAMRSEAIPNIPTLNDILPGYEASAWQGLVTPKNTPAAIVGRLNLEINAALGDPKIKARFAELGVTLLPSSQGEFGKFIAAQTEKLGKVIRAANIKPE